MGIDAPPQPTPQNERALSPEAMGERLKRQLAELAVSVNEELAPHLPASLKEKRLVDETGALAKEPYLRLHGGPFTKEQTKEHAAFVTQRERDWSAADNPKVQKYYREKYGAKDEEALIAAWRAERLHHDGPLAEMAVTILMHKFLHDKFFVLRTNPYDDYKHGIDNYIIEKSTGAVVCTFDEFIGAADDERYVKKLDRERAQARREGATISYGLGLTHAKGRAPTLVRQEVHHMPTFTLRIDTEELHALVADLGETLDTEPGEACTATYARLTSSLLAQAEGLRKTIAPDSPVRARMEEFMGALSRMEATPEAVT